MKRAHEEEKIGKPEKRLKTEQKQPQGKFQSGFLAVLHSLPSFQATQAREDEKKKTQSREEKKKCGCSEDHAYDRELHRTKEGECKTCKWIQKAKAKHGLKFDYSKAIFTISNNKVEITCTLHGQTYRQTFAFHVKGDGGCAKCKAEKFSKMYTRSTSEFVTLARQAHGDIYDYTQTVYIRNSKPVTIRCLKHGLFQQRAETHLKCGCPKCGRLKTAKKRTFTRDQFLAKARNTHGDLYNYDKVKYVNCRVNVIISCKLHGDFEQSPPNHLAGQGCMKCGLRSTKEEFIRKAREIHGDQYSYNNVVYVTNITEVTIDCPKHGAFQKTPTSHYAGTGCPKCTTKTFPKWEQTLIKHLTNRKIPHEHQKWWPDCRGRKRPLRFDCYIPAMDICIELDGIQHFVDFYDKGMEWEIKRGYDITKNQYCKDKGMGLLRISYSRSKDVVKIVDAFIAKYSVMPKGTPYQEFVGEEYKTWEKH